MKKTLEDIKVIEQTKFSARCLILVYFSTQFHENIFDGL